MVIKTLKRVRSEYGYSAIDMANILGISSSYYYQIESGKRNLSYIMAVKISSIFNVRPDDLFYCYYANKVKNNKINKVNIKEPIKVKFYIEDKSNGDEINEMEYW